MSGGVNDDGFEIDDEVPGHNSIEVRAAGRSVGVGGDRGLRRAIERGYGM